MLIRNSAKEIIGPGYAHWAGKPVTPSCHEILYVPQSMADGWDAFCSCGEWRAFETFYEIPERDELLAALKLEFEKHRTSVDGQPTKHPGG